MQRFRIPRPLEMLTLALSLAAPATTLAATGEIQIPVRGTIVSVNRHDATVVLRYTPPGSQPATSHVFGLTNHNDVLRLHVGAVIDATSDTTHKLWMLSNVNIESDRPIKGQAGP